MLHLIRRFYGYVTSEPPTPTELDEVRLKLSEELFDLFVLMNAEDQRHAIVVAGRIDNEDLTEAALLHDVGKSASSVGAIGRSLATISGALSLPKPGSWDVYLRHGEIGAVMLEDAGASALTVAFARFHPGPAPHGVSSRDWHALEMADDL